MIFGSVCSGIEAASVAWHPLGWRASFLSEIDAFPRAVLKHHYPGVPLRGDFTEIQVGDHDAIDVLVGGTPCQSFSVAGLRGGLDDARGNLALQYLRLAQRLRPSWLVWENVSGVLSSNGGRDFGSILGGMVQLGYGFAYRVLDAQYFGLAQRRKRVFVVGYLGDWRRAAAVLFEPASLRGNPAPSRESREGIAPTLSARTKGGGGLGTDFDCDGGLISHTEVFPINEVDSGWNTPTGIGVGENGDPAPTIQAGKRHGVGVLTHALRGEGFDASEDGTGRGTPIVPVSVALRGRDGGGSIELGDDLACALRSSQGGGDKPHVLAFSAKDSGADAQLDLSPTLRAGAHYASHANGGVMPAIQHGLAVRRLTPRECERLQGFPEDYTLIPYRGKLAADGPRYKAIGNSMAVPCMRWIGSRIAAADALERKVAA